MIPTASARYRIPLQINPLTTYVLVTSGLLMYAAVFVDFRGINEVTTFGMFMTFLTVRFIAEVL